MSQKPPLLLLVHRIPYPPNKGDKIRSYHLLRFLAEHYAVYLGAFVDDEADWVHQARLEGLCAEVKLLALKPRSAKIKSLVGLLTQQALSCPYYFQREMQQWVSQMVAQHSISQCVVYSSTMAQYVLSEPALRCKIVDFVDVDSDKWRQYAPRSRFPMNWVYQRESRLLLRYEQQVADASQFSFFVSQAEADLFKQLTPSLAHKIGHYANGVDSDYFDPALTLSNPYAEQEGPVIVFTGAMDYFANEDAVVWFVHKVMRILRKDYPNVRFYIVGSRPTEAVQQLAKQPNVVVTGRVEDVRGYVQHATCAVAPMQIARGIQNKVLEALSMATAVVCTQAAAEGLEPSAFLSAQTCDEPHGFAAIVADLIANNSRAKSLDYREYVVKHYSWSSHLTTVKAALEQYDA